LAEDVDSIFEKVVQGRIEFGEDKGITGEAKDLMSKMLTHDPKERINAVDALNHPWFKVRKSGRV